MSREVAPDMASQTIAMMRISVQKSLNAIDSIFSNYDRYKLALDLALARFQTEANLARLQEIRSEFQAINLDLEHEPESRDPDHMNELLKKIIALSSSLLEISEYSNVTEVRSPNFILYRQFEELASKEYEQFSTLDAISLFPKTVLSLMLATAGLYLFRFLPLIRSALADQGSPSPAREQALVVTIYVVLAMASIVLLTLIYTGFLAKPKKDQKAAHAVYHFLSFFTGSFVGFLTRFSGG